MNFKFKANDRVYKPTGYGFPGTVIAGLKTLTGQERYVVELDRLHILHIFRPDQLELEVPEETKEIDNQAHPMDAVRYGSQGLSKDDPIYVVEGDAADNVAQIKVDEAVEEVID